MDIKFKLTLTIQNPYTLEFVDIYKNLCKTNMVVDDDNPVFIGNQDIKSYFTKELNIYCANNTIKYSDLIIDGYEIESETEGIYVYFKTDDLNSFTYTPTIMAEKQFNLDVPQLYAEQLNDNTIKWYWNNDGKSHYLMNEKDEIVAHLPIEVDYYIETNLDTNKTYTRTIMASDGIDISKKSLQCSITLIENKKESIYVKFQEKSFDERVIDYEKEYAGRLKAFSSGIGDDLDCKVVKPDDVNNVKKFKLINKIYGLRANSEIKHKTIKFNYRFMLKGEIDKLTYRASCKVKIRAIEVKRKPFGAYYDVGSFIEADRELEYVFDDHVNSADIYLYSILPKLQKDYNKKYRFEVTVTEAKGNIKIYSYRNGYLKRLKSSTFNFMEFGHYDHKMCICAEPLIIKDEYIEYYPGLNVAPLTGAVNGDFEMSESGKKDMVTNMNVFVTPDNVKNKKYYCVLEDIDPADGYVNHRFDGQVGDDDFTTINGDRITFYSDSIVPDTKEHRDYIAQTEEGEFVILDNKKYIFEYKITDLEVEEENYKRFELEIVSNSNDVAIIEYNKELKVIDGKINKHVKVVVRGIQNATAKWNPLVHNGYYYLNQDEFYLYNKCTVDGPDKILIDVYYKNYVSLKYSFDVYNRVGKREDYNVTLNTKDTLLINPTLFQWIEKKIAPKPISEVDGYEDFLPFYEYYSKPIIFNKRPTSINSITWDEFGSKYHKIDVYVVTFNDVTGEWNRPIQIYKNAPLPKDIYLSQAIRIKIELTPARRPYLRRRETMYSCEATWRENCDLYLSSNLNYQEEVLLPLSNRSNGIYISKIFDLGDTTDPIKRRAVYYDMISEGDIIFYFQHSDSIADLDEKLNNATWIALNNKYQFENLKRFVRIKILLKKDCRLYSMLLRFAKYDYIGMPLEEKMPMFNNIKVSATYNPNDSTRKYEYTKIYELEHNGKEQTVTKDLKADVEEFAYAENFDIKNIKSFRIEPYGINQKSFEVSYNNTLGNYPVKIKSKNVLLDYDLLENNQTGVKFPVKDGEIVVRPIPQQYCPIILLEDEEETIKYNDSNPYRQVFFMDDDFNYTLTNTEKFTSLGFQTFYLQNTDIDVSTVEVKINDSDYDNYTIKDNVIIFDKKIDFDNEVIVKYKIKNSYCVNYYYENDEAVININKDNDTPPEYVTVYFERDKESAYRELRNISLNPIYNTVYNGYIYISDYQTEPISLEIIPEVNNIYANGKDQCNVFLRVKDKYSNPIQSCYVDVVAASGKIKKVFDKTDENGIIKCIYTSSKENCLDEIKAITHNFIKAKCNIVNRKL